MTELVEGESWSWLLPQALTKAPTLPAQSQLIYAQRQGEAPKQNHDLFWRIHSHLAMGLFCLHD